MADMQKIIVSGFMQFNDLPYNPTVDVVSELNRRYGVVGIILPVEYEKAANILIKNIDKLNPKFVLSFGLASVDHGYDKEIINLEQCGMNLNDATIPDTARSLKRNKFSPRYENKN